MCSTIIFDVNGRKCLAENYDYLLDHGLVGTNLRGTLKSNGRGSAEGGVEWAVKYGSLTFNQFSLEMPVSGMNESGLCVALMWHEEGDYGIEENYLRLSSLQWIQYQLDNFKTVDEVVSCLEKIRPEQGPIPLHYLLLDSHGNSLIVEFISGELVLHRNAEFPVLTNSTYEKCVAASVEQKSSDKESPGNSVARFIHLYSQLASGSNKEVSALNGFSFLDSVSQSPNSIGAESFPWAKPENDTVTAWSIVFDPIQKSIMLKTAQNSAIRTLNLREANFNVDSDYQIVDINAGTAGSMMPFFEPYVKDKNQAILSLSAPVVGLPDEAIEGLAGAVDFLYRERRMS